MSDDAKSSLKLGVGGQANLNAKTIEAQGKARRQHLTTWFGGIALVLLIVIYGVALYFGKDTHELLAVIATTIGYFAGRQNTRD